MEKTTDFVELEKEMLRFWEERQIFQKLKEKNQNGEPFRFLDGPITANNPMGVHHAWGRTIKDAILRFHAMNGRSCHYRNGFDTQGLWVEVEVEKELGFKDKKDIEYYGIDHFTKKCEERIARFSKTITEQSKRLGQWMDWENSYYTHTDENISGIWHFLKTCDENGWLAESRQPMPWCPRCGTSLSEHEMTGSYKELTHTAVFARLPVKDREFDILVWTTTPWTLSANVALAVHPELSYAVVRVGGGEKPLLLAERALSLLEGKKEVLYTLPGRELDGLAYETFFPFLSVQTDIDHRIVLWEDVAADEGCGVVHIAPGCGAEDFALGERLGLPAVCPVDESGRFGAEYGFLIGLSAKEAAEPVFAKLKEHGKLFKTHAHTHSYPVCWRCKTEVLFRLVRSWVIKTDEIRPRLLAAAAQVRWEPEHIGKRMADWLTNMGDWNISRKRFYGLPLPFYPCPNCGKLTVVGSKEELRKLGGKAAKELPELHRPWIDAVKIRCPHCGGEVSRVPDVGDVWLDAGIVPFSTLGYFTDRKKWEAQFPAEWVTEMREQVRLWFYSLLFMSVTLTGKAPYKRVLAYGSVVSEDGSKFSKTGFMIRFDEAAEKLGADAVRYLFAGAPVSADVRFGYSLGEEARRKLLSLWNCASFFETYASLIKPDVCTPLVRKERTVSDRWLDARLASFLLAAEQGYQSYDTPAAVQAYERFVDDLSNWYIRTNRRRFWEGERAPFVQLFKALKALCLVMAPIAPFLTESVWQKCIRVYDMSAPESVHLAEFPKAARPNEKALKDAETVRKLVALGLKLRNERGLKVKQPLPALYASAPAETLSAVKPWKATIKEELNVKEFRLLPDLTSLQTKFLTVNFKTAGAALKERVQELKTVLQNLSEAKLEAAAKLADSGSDVSLPGFPPLPPELFTVNRKEREHIALASDGGLTAALDIRLSEELVLEGTYRELLRPCQLLRKEAGFRVDQRIRLAVRGGDAFLVSLLSRFGKKLAEETLADSAEEMLSAYDISMTADIAEHPVTVEMSGI